MLWLSREAPLVPGLVSISSEYLDMRCLKWGAVMKGHIWKMLYEAAYSSLCQSYAFTLPFWPWLSCLLCRNNIVRSTFLTSLLTQCTLQIHAHGLVDTHTCSSACLYSEGPYHPLLSP